MTEKGKLIVLGGIDGCGKTTQIKRVAEEMEGMGYEIYVTREHTRDGAAGQLIEEVVNHRKNLDPLALQLTFVADRVDHVSRQINPAIESGKIVITDRYYESTPVYAPKEYREKLLKLNQDLVRRPDLTIIIDLEPEEAVKRLKNGREEETIFEKKEKLEQCRAAYDWFIDKSGDECVKIDGSGSVEEVTARIMEEIKRREII